VVGNFRTTQVAPDYMKADLAVAKGGARVVPGGGLGLAVDDEGGAAHGVDASVELQVSLSRSRSRARSPSLSVSLSLSSLSLSRSSLSLSLSL
jgi:hypothetical protein